MNKKTIIFISIAVGAVILIAIASFLIFSLFFNTNKDYKTKKATIETYDYNFELENTIEITDKNELKQLNKILNTISLDNDVVTEPIAIRNDIKLDLNNGVIFFIQKDNEEYCYIENSNKDVKQIIKFPNELMEYVKSKI